MLLFEVLNAKYAGELKKDLEKEIHFCYSKFSPFADCIRDDKILLRDMLNLVQTNLVKFYVDLREKERIYAFFQNYQRQIYLDAKELEEYLKKDKDNFINNSTLALIYECIDNYEEALIKWK